MLFDKIVSFLFPPLFTTADCKTFPKAPQPHTANTYSLYDYQNKKVKKLIRYLKNHRDPALKKILAKEMHDYLLPILADFYEFHEFEKPFIIPVPISRKRKKERGFNQCDDLAKYLARYITGAQYIKNGIKKHNSAKQSLIKKRVDRYKNAHQSFSLQNKTMFRNADIIIVDDLVTSGATLSAVIRELKKSKTRNIIAITIAH
jgi:competence protein ComFC